MLCYWSAFHTFVGLDSYCRVLFLEHTLHTFVGLDPIVMFCSWNTLWSGFPTFVGLYLIASQKVLPLRPFPHKTQHQG